MPSGEAELYSLTKGASQALGLMTLAQDLGQTVNCLLRTDASAAVGIVHRQGLGKLRHIRVQYLWIQERVRSGELGVRKVPGKQNPADLLTKHLPASEMQAHCDAISLELLDNRADSAPQLASLQCENLGNDADWWERSSPRSRESTFEPAEASSHRSGSRTPLLPGR